MFSLLVAIVAREVEEVLAAGEAVVQSPPDDVGRAIAMLVHGYFDHALVYLSKEMWRVAMAMTVQSPDSPASRDYVALDRRLRQQIEALIAALQARDQVKAECNPNALGALVFHNLDAMFRIFVTTGQSLNDLKMATDEQFAEIVRLIST